MGWRVFAAAARGSAHRDEGLPCQDALAYAVRDDALVAVVCDGAGSQARSDVGATRLSTRVVERLLTHPAGLQAVATATPELARETLHAAIDAVRQELAHEAEAAVHPLSDFAATLVGVVASAGGGWFFHVGDGLGIADDGEDGAPSLSLPENGEYANETYFVTGEDWQAHLRLAALPAGCARIALMSDGAMPFVMARGHAGFHSPFMAPVTRYLRACTTEAEASAGLAATLADPRTEAITGDDKSLLVALWT